MVQELFNQNIFMYIMLGVCACGVLSKLILNIVYSRLVKASDSMATSKNKLTRLMKMKFETCYKLKIGVNNVDIFVDKYVFHHKFCGILLSTWENIGGQILMLCLLIGSISTVLGLIYECGKTQILSTFSVGIVTSGLLIFLEGMTNLTGKKELMRLNMKDYLENLLKVRLEQENEHPELIEQYKKEYLEQEEEKQAMQSPAFVASTVDTVIETGKKKDKPSTSKFQKKMLKRQKKDAARHEKENKIAEKKAEKEKKLEDKRVAIENRKKEIEEKKKEAREAKESVKREAKLALEKKREAERAEIERIRAEVKAEELRKKDEKRRQDEIKKALSIEKQVSKENKKKQQAEYKTIAQEKKENLLREVQERRVHEPVEDEKVMEPVNVLKEQVAVTLMDETLDGLGANIQEIPTPAYNKVKVNMESVKPQQVKSEPVKVETIKAESNSIMSLNKSVSNTEQAKSFNISTETVKQVAVNHVPTNHVEVNHYQKKNNHVNQVNKKEKKNNLTEDKLIEDILKEFLA